MPRYLIAIFLISTTITLPLAILELGLRIFRPVTAFQMKISDSGLGWEPTQRADGSRVCDFQKEPSPNKTRILLIGDSVLDCDPKVAPFEKSFPWYLSQKMGSDYEIINLAAGGWGTDQEFLAYQEWGKAYQADWVILFFTPANDLFNNVSSKAISSSQMKPWFRERGEQIELVSPLNSKHSNGIESLLVKSEIGKRAILLYQRWHRSSQESKDPLDSEHYAHVSAYRTPMTNKMTRAWRLTEKILAAFRDEVTKTGSRFAIAYNPSAIDGQNLCHSGCLWYQQAEQRAGCGEEKFNFDVYQPWTKLREVSANLQIPLIENARAMERYEHKQIYRDCIHYTEFGAKIMAESVSQALNQLIRTPAKNDRSKWQNHPNSERSPA